MTKTFLFLALGLLAGRIAAQTRPGGPGGPPTPQGSWVLQFKGQVCDQDAARANDDTREVVQGSDANGVPGIGSGGSVAFVHGTISVRRHWVGSGTPTPGQNFRIHSHAGALAVFISTATANDGFSSQSSPNGGPSAVADDLKLVQPGEGSDGDTTVSFSTTGEKADFFVGAAFDGRSATISLGGAEDSKKLYVTGVTRSFPVPAADMPKMVTYPEALGVPALPDSASPTRWSKTIYVGLGEGKSTRNDTFGGPTFTDEDLTTHLGYTAHVLQVRQPNETYDFSGGYTSASETLPSLTLTGYNGWDILGVEDLKINPRVTILNGDFSDEKPYDANGTSKATLKYTWADGLSATAELNVKLHRAAEQVGDLAVVRVTQWSSAPEAVPLAGSVALKGNESWPFPQVPVPEVYKWASSALSIGGKFLAYKPAAIVCTILGLAVPYVQPSAINGQFPRRASIDTQVDTVDWGGIQPGLTYDITQFAWQASTIPQRDDHWILVDRYGIAGFIERAPMVGGSMMRTHIQRTADTRRYHWIYSGPGAGR